MPPKIAKKRSRGHRDLANNAQKLEDQENSLYYQSLLYMSEIIKHKVISKHYNNPLASHFGIEKTKELVAM